jgi:uncharacterized protein YdeI (YjbR/CyaY-like superfamily)
VNENHVSRDKELSIRTGVSGLEKNKKAKAFFTTLNKANIYAIVYRLQTAKKPETRQKRLRMILGMLSRGERFHP